QVERERQHDRVHRHLGGRGGAGHRTGGTEEGAGDPVLEHVVVGGVELQALVDAHAEAGGDAVLEDGGHGDVDDRQLVRDGVLAAVVAAAQGDLVGGPPL